MDLLEIAVVDITRLIASCRALRNVEVRSVRGLAKSRRQKLRAELKRATGAYLKVLTKSKSGVMDESALAGCRVAAEQRMPTALASARKLGALMDRDAGALDGLATTRHDLWRLSHIAIHLREGSALLSELASDVDCQSARRVSKSLQRQFRRALVGYAMAISQERGDVRRSVRRAREAAIGRLSNQCVDDADQLARLETELARESEVITGGVAQPLRHLIMDWTAVTTAHAAKP
jgi:hypothetical protein